jgi:HAD superfamily hydrolase (TIGR01549 family)
MKLARRNGTHAVLFDLDGTLRFSHPSFNDAYLAYASQLGLVYGKDHRQLALRWLHYYWAQSSELLADLETYSGKEDSFWTNHARLYLLRLGSDEDRAADLASQLFRLMRENYNPEDHLVAEVPQVLQTLKEGGFRLAVVSNRTNPFDQELVEHGIQTYFEFALAAGPLKSWKPDPAIFQHALDLLGLHPQQVLYVGDNYYADVLGARNAGLQPVLIDAEGIFPEADCAVIRDLGELTNLLRN